MQNRDVARVFAELGELLQIQGGDPHRARAFRHTAELILGLGEPLSERLKQGNLDSIRGLGEGSIARMKEILTTGTCEDYRRLTASLPPGLVQVMKVRGMGPGLARLAFQDLGVHDVASLEAAARDGRLMSLPGMSEKVVTRVLTHCVDLRAGRSGRILLATALRFGDRMLQWLRADGGVVDAAQVGSARRGKETVGDLDFVAAARRPGPVVERFVTFPGVSDVLMRGDDRASVLLALPDGEPHEPSVAQADIWVVRPESFGAGLHAFSGTQSHVVQIRARANKLGLHIAEDGVWERKLHHAGRRNAGTKNRDVARCITPGTTEADVFAAVGLPFIPPELRHGEAEIDDAEARRLPVLVEPTDIMGDLLLLPDGPVHARACVESARARGWTVAGLLVDATNDVAAGLRALEDLEAVAAPAQGIEILLGVVLPIDTTGVVTHAERFAGRVDLVAGLAVPSNAPAVDDTNRIAMALASGALDVWLGPRGRALLGHDGPARDMHALLRLAAKHGVAVEVSGDPRALDLDASGCRVAREVGAKLLLTSSASVADELGQLRLALLTARSGGVARAHVVNASPAAAVLDALRVRRPARARGAAPATPAHSGSALHAALHTVASAAAPQSLGEELRTRLDAFLAGAVDEELERTLLSFGPNPLAAAFALVAKDSASG